MKNQHTKLSNHSTTRFRLHSPNHAVLAANKNSKRKAQRYTADTRVQNLKSTDPGPQLKPAMHTNPGGLLSACSDNKEPIHKTGEKAINRSSTQHSKTDLVWGGKLELRPGLALQCDSLDGEKAVRFLISDYHPPRLRLRLGVQRSADL